MAKYNVVFTIKDKYGHEKELVGGAIEVDLDKLALNDTEAIAEALNLDEYVTDQELTDAIKDMPTVERVKEIVKTDVPSAIKENKEAHKVVANVVETHAEAIKYGSFTSTDIDGGDCCDV
jgi:hypothetical protein